MSITERLFFGILISVCLFTGDPYLVVVVEFYMKNRIILDCILKLCEEIISSWQGKTVEAQEKRVREFFVVERRFQYSDGVIVDERITYASFNMAH